VGKELHVTLRDRQPYVKGLFTAALSEDYFEGRALKDEVQVWIKELASVLCATVTVSPAIKNAPLDWEVRDYTPVPVRRMVQLPTNRTRAYCCVDGRLADIAFVNQQGRMMDTIRVPGPDPDLMVEGDDAIVVQHGHFDPVEYGVEGEKSWEGCGWRTAKVMSLRVSGWDFYLLHDPEGRMIAVRENLDGAMPEAA
jgi:hypothetical protein